MERRGFFARLAAAAGTAAALPSRALAQGSPASPHDRWLTGLTGAHKCFFDFPEHDGGRPLLHIMNYINTYKAAYGAAPGTINTVGTCYGAPDRPSSMALGWNDFLWEKHKIGELLGLTDPVTKAPSKRNMFYRPRAGDPVLMNGAAAAAGMENLQKQGTVFLMCNNALARWVAFLSGSGSKGNPAEIEKEIRANLIPGVVVVPAMVIAIEKAQGAGVAYNRQ
ncbi:MAG: hypothetical protein HOP28_11715 [Gemmatimonadales bacterium]|nr:hypothetical protein [Gemmatimonadales bacterium]